MLISIPNEITRILDTEKDNAYRTKICELWGDGFPTIERLELIRLAYINYLHFLDKSVKGYPEEHILLDIIMGRMSMLNMIVMADESGYSKSTKLELYYQLYFDGVDQYVYRDRFIEEFENLTISDTKNISNMLLEVYFTLKAGLVKNSTLAETASKIKNIKNQVVGISDNPSIQPLLEILYLEEVLQRAMVIANNGFTKLETIDEFVTTAIEEVATTLHSLEQDHLLLNVILLQYKLFKVSTAIQQQSPKDSINTYYSELIEYLIQCLRDRKGFTKSLLRNNTNEFTKIIILLNGILMISGDDVCEYLRNLLQPHELQYVETISDSNTTTELVHRLLSQHTHGSFDLSVMEYFESNIYHLIEPIIDYKEMNDEFSFSTK